MNALPKDKKNISLEFLALVGAAFILSYVPFANIPFTWIMTFFHEISHDIGSLVTGGGVDRINLHLDGSGLCYTTGGIRFVVLHAGYVGAVLWGVLIYELAEVIGQKHTKIIAVSLAGLIAASALLYGRDIVTWGILAVLFGLFVSIIKLQGTRLMKLSLKFIGIYVLLDAVRAPLHLIDGRHYGDGARLSDLTGIPEVLWVAVWLGIGIGGVVYLWGVSREEG